MEIIDVTSAEQFKEVIEKHKIVLVDFWATWCQPCRMLSEIYKQMKDEIDKEIDVVVAKVNTETGDQSLLQLVAEFKISSIPAVFMFRDAKLVQLQDEKGQTHDRLVGVRPKEMYIELVDFLNNIEQDKPEESAA